MQLDIYSFFLIACCECHRIVSQIVSIYFKVVHKCWMGKFSLIFLCLFSNIVIDGNYVLHELIRCWSTLLVFGEILYISRTFMSQSCGTKWNVFLKSTYRIFKFLPLVKACLKTIVSIVSSCFILWIVKSSLLFLPQYLVGYTIQLNRCECHWPRKPSR